MKRLIQLLKFSPGHDSDIPMSGTFVKAALALVSPNNDQGQNWTAARDKSK